RNYRLYQDLLNGGQYLEWAVIALFYAALQLVDAHATQNGRSLSVDHVERRRYVRDRLRSIWYQYGNLENASRECRYELRQPSEAEVLRFHDRDFKHIEAQLRNRGIGL